MRRKPRAEFILLSTPTMRRIIRVLVNLTIPLVFLLNVVPSFASPKVSPKHLSYRTELGNDLDGDQIPETATIRQCGHLYRVSIHFTSGRKRVDFTTYVADGTAGLTFNTTDVNDDSKSDLVISSATSVRPVAVWLNQGKARFQKVSSWVYGGVGGYTGPTLRHRATNGPEPVGNILIEPLPQAATSTQHFGLETDTARLISSTTEQFPFNATLSQVPPRGPPAASV